MIKKYKETDLYNPIKKFLQSVGYKVNGEVKNCDLTAIKDDELIVVELKTNFNITLLYQAIERQSITSQVYIGIPRPTNKKNYNSMIKLCKKLEIGIITVSLDSPTLLVEILLFPTISHKGERLNKKKRVVAEIFGRTIDINTGGSNKKKIMTAYREKNIQIACALEKTGECSAKILIRDYNCPKDTSAILNNNFYNWFSNIARGIYTVSEKGKKELDEPFFYTISNYYRNL